MPDRFDASTAFIAEIRSAQFAVTDWLRRAEGKMLGRLGFDPQECPFRRVVSGPFWHLRAYGVRQAGLSLLIVPAPIKRPYIWDLAPEISVVGACLRQGFNVFLLEWNEPSADMPPRGLKHYTEAIADCVAHISSHAEEDPFLMGHSLGGTLGAIYSALSARLRGLVLIGAPLCFDRASSRFRDELVSIIPTGFANGALVPGSLLTEASVLASPGTFIWERLRDAALSLIDPAVWPTLLRVERWGFDEMPLPGRLVSELVELLYRDNLFFRGTLEIDARPIGPDHVKAPLLAVVNTADEIAPFGSITPFTDAVRARATKIIDYPGEAGVGLQHLALLIGREAHARIWPEIFSWMFSVA